MHQVNAASSTLGEVFVFPWYLSLLPVLATIVLLVLGCFCWRRREIQRISFIFFTLSVIAGTIIAPAVFRDRIIVTSQGISSTTGFWFAPTDQSFTYREVRHIHVTKHHDLKGRATPAWEVHYQDGRIRLIPLGDLWSLNSERIAELLRHQGVHFLQSSNN